MMPSTCWLMIGCSTRWPIDASTPASLTSASHAMCVWSPSPLSVNDVVMSIIAPMPLPLPRIDANSSGRSSSCSNSIVILSPPSPSGTLTLARQCVGSMTSKPSTPGIRPAMPAGSLMIAQTRSREASNSRGALDIHALSTFTSARVAAGSCRIEKTRW